MNFDGFLKFLQKIDLNEPEYVENYGDSCFKVKTIFYIVKKLENSEITRFTRVPRTQV